MIATCFDRQLIYPVEYSVYHTSKGTAMNIKVGNTDFHIWIMICASSNTHLQSQVCVARELQGNQNSIIFLVINCVLFIHTYTGMRSVVDVEELSSSCVCCCSTIWNVPLSVGKFDHKI